MIKLFKFGFWIIYFLYFIFIIKKINFKKLNPFPWKMGNFNANPASKEIIIKCSIKEMIRAFFQDYVIVWHDPNVNIQENQHSTQKFLWGFHLHRMGKSVKTYQRSKGSLSCHNIRDKWRIGKQRDFYESECCKHLYLLWKQSISLQLGSELQKNFMCWDRDWSCLEQYSTKSIGVV